MIADLNNSERLLKAAEVSQVLRVSIPAVYRLMLTDLPCVRFAGSVRVRPADLDAYIAKHIDHHTTSDRTE
jgi:predicted DNA-binding transcriptional regulator AlpA